MQRLSVSDIIDNINSGKTFDAVAEDYSFSLKIEEYVPYICGAVHDGHNFRKELWYNCLHTEYERWYEEDPETKSMVKTLPIVLAGMDSRFEYDLNRDPINAIYTDAWGKKLWNTPLTVDEKKISLDKHKNFYKVVKALVEKIEKTFGACVVYDMHSYNWKRWNRDVPTWNLGTSNVDEERFSEFIESWREYLSTIEFPYSIKSTSLINDTFQGNGYFLKFITSNFANTLVLATEIKKIYCDELTGVIFPEIVNKVENSLKTLIPTHAQMFYDTFGTQKSL